MSKHFACSATFPTSTDVNVLHWSRVQEHGWMHKALVIHELVTPAALHEAIDKKTAAERFDVNEIHCLELRLRRTQNSLELVANPETRLEHFFDPLRHG